MNRKLILIASVVIFGSGVLGRVAEGRNSTPADRLGIEAMEVIQLWVPGCDDADPERCRYTYRLRDTAGRRSGTLVTSVQPYFDVEGNVVGRHRLEWLGSPNTSTKNLLGFVTFIASIKQGPHTQPGTITALGFVDLRSITLPLKGISELAITGGTGAYRGASGHVTEVYDPARDDFAITYHLTHS